MTSMNFRHTYTSSEDVVARCVRRRSAFNIFNKEMMTSNQSTEFARAQILKRTCLGGTTIFITSEEELDSGSTGTTGSGGSGTTGSPNATTPSGTEYLSKCVPCTRKKTVLQLKNKF